MAKNERRGGQYRKMLLEQRGQALPEEEQPLSGGAFFRIRFYTCLCLFAAYVIFDYTKASVGSVDSSRIYAEIERDLTEDFDLQEAWSKAVESVWVSEPDTDSGVDSGTESGTDSEADSGVESGADSEIK